MESLQSALITFTSLLFIVDPVAAVPAYLVVTQNETPEQRRSTARRACISMAIILIVFAAAGSFIFRAFGITLPAFRIAGGLILWLVALDMLHAQRTTQESREELAEGEEKNDVAFTPLAMPILAGPGAISTAMVMVSQAQTFTESATVYVSIVLISLTAFIALSLGEKLLKLLGRTGVRVLTRLMGLLLAAVATQFILTGIHDGLMK